MDTLLADKNAARKVVADKLVKAIADIADLTAKKDAAFNASAKLPLRTIELLSPACATLFTDVPPGPLQDEVNFFYRGLQAISAKVQGQTGEIAFSNLHEPSTVSNINNESTYGTLDLGDEDDDDDVIIKETKNLFGDKFTDEQKQKVSGMQSAAKSRWKSGIKTKAGIDQNCKSVIFDKKARTG